MSACIHHNSLQIRIPSDFIPIKIMRHVLKCHSTVAILALRIEFVQFMSKKKVISIKNKHPSPTNRVTRRGTLPTSTHFSQSLLGCWHFGFPSPLRSVLTSAGVPGWIVIVITAIRFEVDFFWLSSSSSWAQRLSISLVIRRFVGACPDLWIHSRGSQLSSQH